MGQQNPYPHRGHQEHQHHHPVDRPSPMNFVWGLILALLTFLLIVICALSIHWISKLSAPDTPSDVPDDQKPPVEQPPVEEPQAPEMDASSLGQAWSLDHPTATLTFISNAAFADFESVSIDGNTLVPTTDYTVKEGSTSVTIHAQYLATLQIGIHTVEIHSTNGVASTTFEIKDKTPVITPPTPEDFLMVSDDKTVTLNKKTSIDDEGVYSNYAIIVDLSTNRVLAEYSADVKMYPASLTKIMTLLVASENLKMADMDLQVMMSSEVINYMQSQNASGFGFQIGEKVRVIDLMYAIALESDGAASMQLAIHIAGSQEAFVQMMNEKAQSLGLVQTHFENVSGLHHPEHVSTCREMATIMAAAMANEQVKQMLSAKEHKTATSLYPVTFKSTYYYEALEGLPATQPYKGPIIAAKTGKTDEAGYCLATYMESRSGGRYIVITAKANSRILYVDDYLYLYDMYAQ